MSTDYGKSGARVLVETLLELGVDTVFGYPGGAVLPIYDELFGCPEIRHVLVRHEAGAVHAAEGYARSTGKVGVVLVTSGPGVVNTVTGLADALMDSIPVLVLCGQVPSHLIGTDAFQECDAVGITRHCTKHNYQLRSPDEVRPVLQEGFAVARSGRPGPVAIVIPKDVQVAEGSGTELLIARGRERVPAVPVHTSADEAIRRAKDMILRARRPVFYTGGGLVISGDEACATLRDLAALIEAPVTSTLMGLGAFPAHSPQWLGMLGMHGTYEANLAMHHADLVLAVGARFDDRVTGRLDGFAPHARKIHIDIDPSAIGKNVPVDVPIVGDAGAVLRAILELLQTAGRRRADTASWWRQIDQWRKRDCLAYERIPGAIAPQFALQTLWRTIASRNPIVSTEVGQHQMWAAQHLGFAEPRKWLTSGGLGTMGYGLPAAIGAQIGNPGALVVDISGDASFQMNMQEMATATQYRLPIKIFMLNNERLGMVKQLQDVDYGGRHSQSYSDSLPDFVKLAQSYAWKGLRIDDPSDLEQGVQEMVAHDGPVLIDVHVSRMDNVYPMVPSGAAHTEMLLGPDDRRADGGISLSQV